MNLNKLLFLFYYVFKTFLLWSESPHMLNQAIAQNILQYSNPKAYKWILEKIKIFDQSKNQEADKLFIRAGLWADQWKGKNLSIFNHLHFFEDYYQQDGPYQEIHTSNWNIVNALNFSYKYLNQYQWPKKINNFLWALSLSMIFHFAGDIHQPLHTVSLQNKDFQQGDWGGNRYFVNLKDGKQIKLHQFWDQGLRKIPYYKSWLENSELKNMKTFSDNLIQKYLKHSNVLKERLNNRNFFEWAQESQQIAIKHVYQDIQPNETLKDSYIEKNKEFVFQQVFLCGYRLALLLENIYNAQQNNDVNQIYSIKGYKKNTIYIYSTNTKQDSKKKENKRILVRKLQEKNKAKLITKNSANKNYYTILAIIIVIIIVIYIYNK